MPKIVPQAQTPVKRRNRICLDDIQVESSRVPEEYRSFQGDAPYWR